MLVRKTKKGVIIMKKTVLVIGGSKGIGFATAKKFMENDFNVIITGRNIERLKKASIALNNCPYIIWDVKDVSKAEEYVATAHDCFGSIDVFVNNAGIVTDAQWNGEGFPNVSMSTWDDTMDVNLRGIYFLCQAEAKYMIKNAIKGHIVNVCSEMGFRAAPDAYGISKWGVRGMTLGIARSLATHKIVVNAVAPGETATEILRQKEDVITKMDSPRGIRAMPCEIANAIYFLATDDNMIGTILQTDGGRSLY